MVLVRIEETGVFAKTHGVNPYGRDAWLLPPEAAGRIVLDFPRLPDAVTNETRRIERPAGGPADPFVQRVAFGPRDATAVLSSRRGDREYAVSIVWAKGAKWWKAATVIDGTNVVLSARLRFAE